MSEPVLPLGGASFDGLVRVSEFGPLGQVTLRGDLESKTLKTAVKQATGHDVPDQRGVTGTGESGVLWMSPDELLILTSYAQAPALAADLQARLAGTHAMVVNMSDARAVFRIECAQVRDVLAKIAPVDLAFDRFAPGELRRTRLAQAAAGFWLVDNECAQIFCFRSVAEYMFDLLSTVSAADSAVGYYG